MRVKCLAVQPKGGFLFHGSKDKQFDYIYPNHTQAKVVWDKKHFSILTKWRFGMLVHPKLLRNEYISNSA